MRTIVLASTSPYRRALMERLHLDFEVAAPDCDETRGTDEPAPDLVMRLAETKAASVAADRATACLQRAHRDLSHRPVRH